MAFLTRDWAKYIGDSLPFHFDASSEDITGLLYKIKYLDKIGDSLKNILIVSDPAVYMGAGNEGRFGFNEYYKINGTSAFKFHFTFFKGFYTDFFYLSYIDYSVFKKYRAYMGMTIPNDMAQYTFDSITNDFTLFKRIRVISKDSEAFYSNKAAFYDRIDTTVSVHWACIDNSCMEMLREIRNIFQKHNTKYKIIISPDYSQQYFNKTDLKNLQLLFGENNVYDFSGKNSFTNNKGNFYDNIHYKPEIGRLILERIYLNKYSAKS